MEWLKKQVSLYFRQWDKIGRPETLRDILFCHCLEGIEAITELRGLDPEDPEYKVKAKPIKSKLQLFAPAALLETREKEKVKVLEYSGLMQLDFDYEGIKQYDIEELKQAVFALPFIAFAGLSCSGNGFFALVAIAEPERLAEYAEHCFKVFAKNNIPVDSSKGRNPQDLRYSSYDSNMLFRDNPEPLRIPKYTETPKRKRTYKLNGSSSLFIQRQLDKIKAAQKGARWQTVQHVAYTLGGTGNANALDLIKSEIENNPEFNGEHDKYFKCADDCFADGVDMPLTERNARAPAPGSHK
jgi:hypothetical protein